MESLVYHVCFVCVFLSDSLCFHLMISVYGCDGYDKCVFVCVSSGILGFIIVRMYFLYLTFAYTVVFPLYWLGLASGFNS